MDGTDRLYRRDPAGENLLDQNQFPKGSRTTEIKISCEESQQTSMSILTDDHPHPVFDGNQGMKHSTS